MARKNSIVKKDMKRGEGKSLSSRIYDITIIKREVISMKMTKTWWQTTRNALAITMVLLFIGGIGVSGYAEEEVKPSEAVLGALLALTGDYSSTGEASLAALEVALSEINEYLSDIGSKTKVRLITEDTKTDPMTALEKIKSLAKRGVKIVIGPQTSAEVKAVKDYADENGILLLSQSSTAPSLSIPKDNVFRFCPDDTLQAQAIANLIWEDEVRVVIPMWRGDAWGDELSEASRDSFEKLGGTVIDGIRYSPNTKDFFQELEFLNSKVRQAIAQYGEIKAVGVNLMSFEEVVPIFIQAQDYPILSRVKWYGSDSTALSKGLVGSEQAAQFAVITGFPNPIYGGERILEKTEKYVLVKEQIQKKIGRVPDPYAIVAYDAFWVASLAYLVAGVDNSRALKETLVRTAESYFGATGWTILNKAGNRKFCGYDFWAVRKGEITFRWERVGEFRYDPSFSGRLIYEKKSSLVPSLRILVVHSYHEEWEWDQDIGKGIVEGLNRKGYVEGQDYELKTFYMDSKITYTTPEQIKQRAKAAIDIIEEISPDIVFVNDDNALTYVAAEYTKRYPEKNLPFVFSGVNADPTTCDSIESLEVPGGPITGALERFPYYEAFSLGKTIFPNTSRILLLADRSPSSTFVVNAFRERYLDKVGDSPLQVSGPIQVETFKEWKEKITEYQTKADFIGIITYHQLKDENGKVVLASEVVDWTVYNSRLPEIGFLSFHTEDGFLAAAGISGYKTGIYVGIIGGEILEGKNPATIPIVDPKAVEITFNLERAKMLGVKIPATELTEAIHVFHSIGVTGPAE